MARITTLGLYGGPVGALFGIFVAGGATPPDGPGIEYAPRDRRFHYRPDARRAHYVPRDRRLHYTPGRTQ